MDLQAWSGLLDVGRVSRETSSRKMDGCYIENHSTVEFHIYIYIYSYIFIYIHIYSYIFIFFYIFSYGLALKFLSKTPAIFGVSIGIPMI